MTDRGIIFAAPMVCALFDDRKTQTRRLGDSPLRKAEIGDRLWVRETCRAIETETGTNCVEYAATQDWEDDVIVIENSAEAAERWIEMRHYDHKRRKGGARQAGGIAGPWVPSIHMPRWASRLTLIVKDVRMEPLRAISRDDAISEGLQLASANIEEFWRWPAPYHEGHWLSPPAAYFWLWDQLHTEPGQRSEDNPEVVALTFRVISQNIDRIPG